MDDEPPDMPPAPDRLRRLPSWLTSRARLLSSRLVISRLATVDADRLDYALLSALDEYGSSSQARLARRCGVDPSDAVAVVGELEARKLAVRRRDPDDRRRNLVEITPTGLDLLAQMDVLVEEAQDAYLAPLSAAERDRFVALLTKVVGDRRRARE